MRKISVPSILIKCFDLAIPICLFLSLGTARAQVLVSATPDYDGNIYYTVQANDTCLSISLKMGIDIDSLRQLNDLDVDCSLIADTRLLLGRVLTPTPTIGPSPTPTPILPTPTPYDGNASVCIMLFDDLNGNSTVQGNERGVAGGAVSVTKRNGTENFTGLTTGFENLCFPEVPEGTYVISVALPNDYNPTTAMNNEIEIKAGDIIQVNFGAQKQAVLEQKLQSEAQQALSETRSPIIAFLGGGLILAAIALAIVYSVLQRRD